MSGEYVKKKWQMAVQKGEILDRLYKVEGMKTGRYRHVYATCEQEVRATKGRF